MAAIDLSTRPGLAVTDPANTPPALQKAYLVAWLLMLTNTDILNQDTRIVKSQADLDSVNQAAAATAGDINYLNMANIYPKLDPMSTRQVDSLLNLARSNPHFTAMAATYWTLMEDPLFYSNPRYCLGVPTVLGLST